MMEKYIVLCAIIYQTILAEAYCPSLCTCKNGKQSDESILIDPNEYLRLRCGSPDNPISELKELSLHESSEHIISLNLSGNVISTLSRELHLPKLQKLDLSRNQITLIESDAFYNLTSLQRLDLSGNQISYIYKEIFKGLINLEKLNLAQNKIESISAGTFDYLMGLKQLDISNNLLKCDCDLLWLNEWLRDHSAVKLANMPKCYSPSNLKGQSVRKLKLLLDLTLCSEVLQLNSLIVKPLDGQVVFSGDAITMTCRAPFVKSDYDYKLTWTPPLTTNATSYNTTNYDAVDEGVADSMLIIPFLNSNHSGNWTCHFVQAEVDLTQNVSVTVVDENTRFCVPNNTENNRGFLSWPLALVNHTVVLSCGLRPYEIATRYCNSTGHWTDLNTTACPYVSELTKILQQMAVLNTSIARDSVNRAAEKLSILLTKEIAQDADDILFIQRAIYNYMPHAQIDNSLARTLLEAIERVMTTPSQVMVEAEKQYRAATLLAQAVETLSKYNQLAQLPSLAVERLGVKRETFKGLHCIWYIQNGSKKMHCSSTSLPEFVKDYRTVFAKIIIPPTLFYQSTDVPHNKIFNLIVTMYENASLFPLLPAVDDGEQRSHRTKDLYGVPTRRDDINLEIVSPVVGVAVENVSWDWRLAAPVTVSVRALSRGGRAAQGPGARPALYMHKWTNHTDDCEFPETLSHHQPDMVEMRCYKLGYIGLLRNVETGYYGGRTYAARFKFSHPAIYVGGLVLTSCLFTIILTYVAWFSRIRMNSRDKHSLINTYFSIVSLCILYSLGVYQTEDARLCRILGLLLHYLILSSLFWQVASAGDLYSAARKLRHPNAQLPRPATELYLIGWGIPLLVCGVTGAVNIDEYAAQSQCFLSTLESLSALLIPAGIALIILAVLLGLTAKVLGNEATFEARQLRANIATFSAYISSCLSGAAAVYRPFPSYLPYQEDMSSIIYAVSTSVLGTFVLFFYGISRADVRDQWNALKWREGAKLPIIPPPPPSDKSDISREGAALHLNGHLNGKICEPCDADLVELHRRQYRSDDSTTDDSNSKVFYNPNQIEMARKFFRRQRRNFEGNILELASSRRNCEEVNDSDVRQNDSSRNGDINNKDGWDEAASIRSHGLYPPAPHRPSIALSAV